MAESWYFQVNGQIYGPLIPQQLKRQANAGIVERESLVRNGEAGKWQAACHVKGLCSLPPKVERNAASEDDEALAYLGVGAEPATPSLPRIPQKPQTQSNKHGEQSRPTELVTPIDNAHKRLKSVVSGIRRLPESPAGQILTQKRIVIGGLAALAILLIVVVPHLLNGRSGKESAGSASEAGSTASLAQPPEQTKKAGNSYGKEAIEEFLTAYKMTPFAERGRYVVDPKEFEEFRETYYKGSLLPDQLQTIVSSIKAGQQANYLTVVATFKCTIRGKKYPDKEQTLHLVTTKNGLMVDWAANVGYNSTSPFGLSVQELSPGFHGHDIQRVYDALRMSPKGEFETTKQYEDRLLAFTDKPLFGDLGVKSLFAFATGPVEDDVSYDADHQVMTVTVPIAYADITVRAHKVHEGDYVGENAYGAKSHITKAEYRHYIVTVTNATDFIGHEPGLDETLRLKASQMDVDTAREAKPNLRILLLCHLVRTRSGASVGPFTEETHWEHAPRRDEPEEFLSTKYHISANVEGIWLYNFETGRIYVKFGSIDRGKN